MFKLLRCDSSVDSSMYIFYRSHRILRDSNYKESGKKQLKQMSINNQSSDMLIYLISKIVELIHPLQRSIKIHSVDLFSVNYSGKQDESRRSIHSLNLFILIHTTGLTAFHSQRNLLISINL